MDMDTQGREGEESVSFAAPPGFKMPPAAKIRETLLASVEELSKYGLKLSAKWAAELLVGLPEETLDERQQGHRTADEQHQQGNVPDFLSTPAPPQQQQQQQQKLQQQTQQRGTTDAWLEGRVVFAKTLMDVGEFERASKVFGDGPLQPPTATGDGDRALHSHACFLRWYSLFLAGERRREEESQLTDALQRRRQVNPNLKALHAELSACDMEGSLDSFGLFIYGAVLKAMRGEGRGCGANTPPLQTPAASSSTTPSAHQVPTAFRTPRPGRDDLKTPTNARGPSVIPGAPPIKAANAQEVLVRSLRLFPYNWSAWQDLASLCLDSDTFFLQHLMVEQHRCKDALSILDYLQLSFPASSYVLSQTAVAHYHLRNFDEGHKDFKELRARDPLRMEGLDVFSNILYVKECKAELSFLAHTTAKSAPLRPETNCIIGNYYSLKGQHEKAVVYFSKALRLDRRCLSAWTLMGHEFVELKNSGAAIESYRQAVEINPKDYRAWYGLGQAYEILQMHLYAIYYYRRATALRPYDARMWIAMGQCLEKLGKRGEAISTYERAMANDDREGISLIRLANLYTTEGRQDSAARCYETMLTSSAFDGDNAAGEEGMLFLCHYYKDKGNYDSANQMAHRLLDCTGTSKEQALAVLRELRSIKETRQRDADMNPPSSASFARPDNRHHHPSHPRFSHASIGDAEGAARGVSGGDGWGGGRGGRPLFTPQSAYQRGGDFEDPVNMGGGGGGGTGRGIRRGGGASADGVGGGGAGAGVRGAGAGQYRLSVESSPPFVSRSSVDMSVAMSMGSDDDELSRQGGREGGVGGGADVSFDDSGATEREGEREEEGESGRRGGSEGGERGKKVVILTLMARGQRRGGGSSVSFNVSGAGEGEDGGLAAGLDNTIGRVSAWRWNMKSAVPEYHRHHQRNGVLDGGGPSRVHPTPAEKAKTRSIPPLNNGRLTFCVGLLDAPRSLLRSVYTWEPDQTPRTGLSTEELYRVSLDLA
eukprot:jgi/Undpi1/12850/HiC_scaffold_7.g02517.m1